MRRPEDVAGAVNELVQEGKVRYFRLSEAKHLPIVKTKNELIWGAWFGKRGIKHPQSSRSEGVLCPGLVPGLGLVENKRLTLYMLVIPPGFEPRFSA